MQFKWTVLSILFFISLTHYSQKIQLTDETKVSIITCGTGQELHSLFGHTGIRIFDRQLGLDLVYNYGAFDFLAPNFYGKFLKGDLLYFIGLDDFNSFLFNYQISNRSVWEQELLISVEQKQAVFDELASTYGTKKALYTYKFIDKNCTTLAVDLLQKNLDIPFDINIPEINKLTDRELLNQYLINNYFAGLGINLVFGIKTDQRFNHIFLPEQLLKSAQITLVNNNPIVGETITKYSAHNNNTSNLPVVIGVSLFFIVIGLLCMYKIIATLFFSFIGIVSLFLFGMQFYSFHNEVHYNYNLLLINPLFLALAFYLITNQYKKYRLLIKVCLYCIVVYMVLVIINGYLFMVFPAILGIALALIIQNKVIKKSRL
jgi:hypothetical protein